MQLDVLRIPQIAEHMAGRHVADPTLTVVVRPTSRSGGAVALISQPLFIDSLKEEELGVLVIGHVMLLIRDHEIFDTLRDGMIGVRHLYSKGPDGRMAGVGRSQNMAKIRIGQSDVRGVVQEECGAACVDELAHGLALLRLHPIL